MKHIEVLKRILDDLENGSEIVEGKLTQYEYLARRDALIVAIKTMEADDE